MLTHSDLLNNEIYVVVWLGCHKGEGMPTRGHSRSCDKGFLSTRRGFKYQGAGKGRHVAFAGDTE